MGEEMCIQVYMSNLQSALPLCTFEYCMNMIITIRTPSQISKHGQASFDPGWTPSLSTSVDLTSVDAGTLIAPLADIFPSFGRGEVYFRESRAGDDITRANNDVHGVSRGSRTHTIDKVIVVTWNDTGPSNETKVGNLLVFGHLLLTSFLVCTPFM